MGQSDGFAASPLEVRQAARHISVILTFCLLYSCVASIITKQKKESNKSIPRLTDAQKSPEL